MTLYEIITRVKPKCVAVYDENGNAVCVSIFTPVKRVTVEFDEADGILLYADV